MHDSSRKSFYDVDDALVVRFDDRRVSAGLPTHPLFFRAAIDAVGVVPHCAPAPRRGQRTRSIDGLD